MGIKGPRSIYGTLGNLNFVRLRRRLLVWTLTREWELPSDFYELRNWSELVVQPRDSEIVDWPLTRHYRDKQRQNAVTHPNPDVPVVFRISFPFCLASPPRHQMPLFHVLCLVPFVPPYFNRENLQHPVEHSLSENLGNAEPGGHRFVVCSWLSAFYLRWWALLQAQLRENGCRPFHHLTHRIHNLANQD